MFTVKLFLKMHGFLGYKALSIYKQFIENLNIWAKGLYGIYLLDIVNFIMNFL